MSQNIFLIRQCLLVLLLLPYFISGFLKLFDFAGAQAEVTALTGVGASAPLAAAVIVTQLGGSAVLLFGGRWAWLGGAALAGFTLVATFLAHTWWHLPTGSGRMHAFNGFWEHIALVGALSFAALVRFRETRT
jgi:transmembrane protein